MCLPAFLRLSASDAGATLLSYALLRVRRHRRSRRRSRRRSVVVVVSWPRRVRLTNLIPPCLHLLFSLPPLLPRSISVRYASLPVHPPTHETARSQLTPRTPPALCPYYSPLHHSLFFLPPCFLFSFSFLPQPFSLPTTVMLFSFIRRLLSPLSSVRRIVARYEKEREKKFFSRVFPPTSLRFVFSNSRLSFPPFEQSPFSLPRPLCVVSRSAGAGSIGGQSRPTRSQLSAIIFCPIVYTHIHTTHIRARVHVATPPIRVFVCARDENASARHTRWIHVVLGSVSLLYASVFFHCVAVYSSFVFLVPLSLSSLLRLVCSSLSPCMRVFASPAARRQRSAATARTTSFILSSLPAMPRVTREPVTVCSPR